MTIRIARVTFHVSSPVEIEHGKMLPAGRYAGTRKETGFANMSAGQVQWSKSTYHIDLSADILDVMGIKHNPNLLLVEAPVTQFVQAGAIEVL
jgi:hypothetical protein